MIFMDYSPTEDCENFKETHGEICVKCNECGRFKKTNDGGNGHNEPTIEEI